MLGIKVVIWREKSGRGGGGAVSKEQRGVPTEKRMRSIKGPDWESTGGVPVL